MDWSIFSAWQIGRMIAHKEVTATEITQDALDRMERLDGQIQAYLTITPDLALHQAAAVDSKLAAGEELMLLAGVPMAVKDNICTQGVRTSCASRMLQRYTPPFSASVVETLSAAGSVMLGKTNLDEFAMGSTTETSAMQITHNPWNTDRVPGGSSGGSAAAVAAGEAYYALGSDTGGSIRQPCSYCGLTGLKPTYGAVSRYGLIAYASSLDQIGPIGRDAIDCAAVFAQLAGADQKDSTSMPASDQSKHLTAQLLKSVQDESGSVSEGLVGKRIAIPESFLSHGLQPDVKTAMEALISRLAGLGAVCEPCELPLLDESIPAYYMIATAEASANLARYDGIQYGHRANDPDFRDLEHFYSRNRAEGFGPEVRQRIMLGTFALSSGYYDAYYLKAQKIRKLIQEHYARLLQDFDFVLSPVAPAVAPPIGTSLTDPLNMYLSDVFTVAANLTGLPALAMPCGFDSEGLPIGFQLTAGALAEAPLLAAGIAYQRATDYHRQRPRIVVSGDQKGGGKS